MAEVEAARGAHAAEDSFLFRQDEIDLLSLGGDRKTGTSAAAQFAEEFSKPFPQGLKPSTSQALLVGAKAPTP